MSVILSWRDPYTTAKPGATCAFCDDPVRPPFVEWRCSDGELYICARCSHWVRDGLAKDMERVHAIHMALTTEPPSHALQ
jgi:hypothetical protein